MPKDLPPTAAEGSDSTRANPIGIAQLSLLETALWPLDPRSHKGHVYETSYSLPDGNRAQVSVWSAAGLHPEDEYILWGLLAQTLRQPEPRPSLVATPYWMLKKLSMPTDGRSYRQLRSALERLAQAGYANTAFYNPVTQEHQRVTFSFLSSWIPTRDTAGTEDCDRSWRIDWSPQFFACCQATGGRLFFDLDLYRQLSPAARRLFLKLKDRFYRMKRVHLNVDDLTTNGLGFARTLPLRRRKEKLRRCTEELLARGIIALGRGQTNPRQLFCKARKGIHLVVFYEGPYFQTRATEGMPSSTSLDDDPLFVPLKRIGFAEPAVRHMLRAHARGIIERWVKITEAAMHDRPAGFPGFKTSPAAFCRDGIAHDRMPPDWLYAHEKEERRRQAKREQAAWDVRERELRARYNAERAAGLKTFCDGPGKAAYLAAFAGFSVLHKALDPVSWREKAEEAAMMKLEFEGFDFPPFAAWLLAKHPAAEAPDHD